MTCDELRPDYVLFAMGTLEDPEKSELKAHLARGCEACAAGIREAQQLTYGLGASAEGPEPSRGLRKRILAGAGEAVMEETRWHWATAWQAAAAVAVLGVAAFLYQTEQKDSEIASLQTEVQQSGEQSASLQAALALLQAPETREVTFGQGSPAAPPSGRVFFDSASVLLIANNLPAPPAGKAYEMWIIPKGGKPAPAGLFASNTQGKAYHFFRASTPLAQTDTVAVTLENAAGVNAPTTTPVIGVAL
jgi:anti-sigma-K factor RskA